MPSREKHIKQYIENKSLANSNCLKQPQYKDWRIVIIYYAALHFLDSTYAELGWHPTTHEKRKKFLDRTPEYTDIIDDYENLEMLSRKSRYNCVKVKDSEVNEALENLEAVEKFVNQIAT